MKCLPTTKLPTAHGNILHDWHAEILCLRAFNHFLLTECKALLTNPQQTSPYLLRLTPPATPTDSHHHHHPFAWRPNVTLHLYCSEAPCGDASMELTIAAQPDAAPWASPLPQHMMEMQTTTTNNHHTPNPPSTTDATTPPPLHLLGRACFAHLGIVRRKPARPDAPPSLSKSCSDKLAAKQCTSLLASVVAPLLTITPGVYLASVVLPASQYSAAGVARCFSTRMAGLEGRVWGGEYAFRPFEVRTTRVEFGFSRRGLVGEGEKEGRGGGFVACNLATAWTARGLLEGVIGGVVQGRKQTDPKGGSAVSRRKMWMLAREVARLAVVDESVFEHGTYAELKESEFLADRRQVKRDIRAHALKGWVRNVGDDDFGIAS